MSDTEKIAAVLVAHQKEMGHRDLRVHCTCGWSSGELPTYVQHTAHVAAALEPVIREREHAAVIEYAMREPAKFQIEFTNQPLFEKTLQEARADARESGVNTGIGYKTAMDFMGDTAPPPANPYQEES